MRSILALASAAVLAGSVSAWGAEPAVKDTTAATSTHTAESMTSGHHVMPANKQHQMSNKAMSGLNPKCSDEALAKMPPEHRAACNKKD